MATDAPAQGTKKFKRGEFIFKEGDKAESIFLIQSGRVSLCLIRPNSRIEIYQSKTGQVVGEQALYGMAKHIFSAEALGEVQVLEVPIGVAKPQIEAASPFLKTVFKSFSDDNKLVMGEIKSFKLEKESVACSELFIPRLFACFNLVTRHLGKEIENGYWEVPWNTLKLFGVRMFLESPLRLQSAVELLTKLKHAEMQFEKSEDGEKELVRVTVKNLQLIEDFCEFYQYNLYKGSVAEILKFDDIAYNVAKEIVKATEGSELDRQGSASVPFNKVVEHMKVELDIDFKNLHLDLLAKKGLFMKRSTDKDVVLSFDRKEFQQTVLFWQIINEIDKWNAVGRVNMVDEAKKKPKLVDSGIPCPDCASMVAADAKFCSNCGANLKAA